MFRLMDWAKDAHDPQRRGRFRRWWRRPKSKRIYAVLFVPKSERLPDQDAEIYVPQERAVPIVVGKALHYKRERRRG